MRIRPKGLLWIHVICINARTIHVLYPILPKYFDKTINILILYLKS